MKKFDVATTWFTSDLHFYHKNIMQYCDRPFDDVEKMNRGIIRNWNKVVGHTDDVFVLGDLGFCGIERLKELLLQLNGNIHLIQGNHDSDKAVRSLLRDNIIRDCERLDFITMVGDEELPEQLLNLCHFPMISWVNKEKGSWMVHGHDHQLPNTPSHSKAHWDVGLDKNCMTPINFEQLKLNITKQFLYENNSRSV